MKADAKRETKEELILRVRQGDQAAFGLLLADYEPLVHAEVSRRARDNDITAEDAEDLHQVALLAFYRAVLGYDLSQGEVEFGLYAKICIANAISSQLRVLRRRCRELPLSVAVYTDGGEDPAGRVMEDEAAALLHARIRAALSPYENRVWNLYTAGLRSGEIAERLGKEPHSVENAVYRIRQKLRRTLGERG